MVSVNDQSDASITTYTVTSATLSRAGFAGLTYGNIAGLSVNGGAGADTYNIYSTAPGTSTTVNGGAASDIFNVGSPASSLDPILGALIVNGGGGTNNVLNVHDDGNLNPQSFFLAKNVLTRSGGVSITYVIPTIKTVNITAGTNNDVFTVTVAPTTTTNLNLGGGTNTLVGPNVSNTWTITSTNHGTLDTKLTFSNAQNLTGGNTSDDFKFSGAGNITGNLDGGAGSGTDKLDYSALGATPIAVNLATGTASRIGGSFSNINSLVGSTATTNTLTGANITNLWSITGLNLGKVNTFSFSKIENLIGGSGLDTFKFSSTAGQVSNITGGGAPPGQGDWLDYSAFDALHPVNVNLALNTATNVSGSIGGIGNVIGGAGADILTGDNNGNILIEHGGAGTINGGTARSLFITGTGAVTVNGGSGGDLFVGGKTSYDTTSAGHLDLMIILHEWRSADPYTTRTDEISDGIIPGHPGIKLFAGSTVVLNSSLIAEHLNGFPSATDLDWFFASVPGQHSPLETVGGVTEVVNNAS